ncbi:MAG: hypothetical protein ABI534_08285 [Chloroflexota bacterium]
MDGSGGSRAESREARRFEVRIQGHLQTRWAAWFEGMSLMHAADGTTALTGIVADQAALHGLLQKLRDLGIQLISVAEVAQDEDEPGGARERRTS